MLLCSVNEIDLGMIVAAPVFHPRRPEIELLEPGVPIDARTLHRLKELGVTTVWVEHDATGDLDSIIDPNMGAARRAAYEQLKQDFDQQARRTISAAQVQTYRRLVMDLVCELISHKHVAGLTEQLVDGPRSLFAHGANVAYLSIIVGLELETYIVQERARLAAEHARDITGMGIGAMLHDIGKLAGPESVRDHHELDAFPDELDPEDRKRYFDHPQVGYEMLRGSRAPATATQIVLNHHQRWNGTGFPDMAKVTRQRREGAQQGSAIHVFSRIVAACNVLDNLMVEADGSTRPPVAALHDLAADRFEGWFDPVVRDAVLRCMPPFAIGSRVTLSDGRAAAVIAPSLVQPCRPAVRLLSDADRLPDGRYPSLDLLQHPELHIAEVAGVKVSRFLYELGDRPQRVHDEAPTPTA